MSIGRSITAIVRGTKLWVRTDALPVLRLVIVLTDRTIDERSMVATFRSCSKRYLLTKQSLIKWRRDRSMPDRAVIDRGDDFIDRARVYSAQVSNTISIHCKFAGIENKGLPHLRRNYTFVPVNYSSSSTSREAAFSLHLRHAPLIRASDHR